MLGVVEGSQSEARVGRRKEYAERMHCLFREGTRSRIDDVLWPDEERLAFVREAVDREIERRARGETEMVAEEKTLDG
ncbi:hypothetical protein [Aureimonas sp. Leaf324]|uniref:hypothetical protein n=1 Tax=Aureimonas sp. Leaf324 TaxID=1736336 RepID=UPI0007003EA4|nr:hypothetical protein [Aureimonas sp. Leaf324]KQQ90993.1 hypothetical protein ASF65_00165 [Aureimonas sp. Leaf324]